MRQTNPAANRAAGLCMHVTRFYLSAAGGTAPTANVSRGAIHIRITTQDSNRSEEHTSELQSLMRNSYAVFCLKKKKTRKTNQQNIHNTIHIRKNTHKHHKKNHNNNHQQSN